MYKKLWSADSNTWFGLALLYAIACFCFGVALIRTPSWMYVLNSLLFLLITIYPFTQFLIRRSLELVVNSEILEFGYTHVLQSVVPEVKDKQFLGFTVDGVNYAVVTVEGGYYVEETKYPNSPVTMYEFQFIDPKNNILVVFNESEPPTKGGVSVFVK